MSAKAARLSQLTLSVVLTTLVLLSLLMGGRALGHATEDNYQVPTSDRPIKDADDNCISALDSAQTEVLRALDRVRALGNDDGAAMAQAARMLGSLSPKDQQQVAVAAQARALRQRRLDQVRQLYAWKDPHVRELVDGLVHFGLRFYPNGEPDLRSYRFGAFAYERLALELFYPGQAEGIAHLNDKNYIEPVVLGENIVMSKAYMNDHKSKTSRVMGLKDFQTETRGLLDTAMASMQMVAAEGNEAGFVGTQLSNMISNPGELSEPSRLAIGHSNIAARNLFRLQYYGYPTEKLVAMRALLSDTLKDNDERMNEGMKQVQAFAIAAGVIGAGAAAAAVMGVGVLAIGGPAALQTFAIGMGFTGVEIVGSSIAAAAAGKGSFGCNIGKDLLQKGPDGFLTSLVAAGLAGGLGLIDGKILKYKEALRWWERAKAGAGAAMSWEGIEATYEHTKLALQLWEKCQEAEAKGQTLVATKYCEESTQAMLASGRTTVGTALPWLMAARAERAGRTSGFDGQKEELLLEEGAEGVGVGQALAEGMDEFQGGLSSPFSTSKYGKTPKTTAWSRIPALKRRRDGAPQSPDLIPPGYQPPAPPAPAGRQVREERAAKLADPEWAALQKDFRQYSTELAEVMPPPEPVTRMIWGSAEQLLRDSDTRKKIDIQAHRLEARARKAGEPRKPFGAYREEAAQQFAEAVVPGTLPPAEKQLSDLLVSDGRRLTEAARKAPGRDPETIALQLRDRAQPKYDKARHDVMSLNLAIARAKRRGEDTAALEAERKAAQAIISDGQAIQNTVANIRLRKRLYQLVQSGTVVIRAASSGDEREGFDTDVPVIQLEFRKPYDGFAIATRAGDGTALYRGYDVNSVRAVPRALQLDSTRASSGQPFQRNLRVRTGVHMLLGGSPPPAGYAAQAIEGDLQWQRLDVIGTQRPSGARLAVQPHFDPTNDEVSSRLLRPSHVASTP